MRLTLLSELAQFLSRLEEAQESLLRSVYSAADIEPGQLAFVEAHGTGTVAGDGKAPHFCYTRRAPRLGEHTNEVLTRAGLNDVQIAKLSEGS